METDTPQRQIRQKMREVRATMILDVAEAILAEKGYRDTSMDEIAARSGVAKGTLYQHFPRKEDLVAALFERGLVLFVQKVQSVASSALPARARLEQILRYIYQEQRGRHAQLLQLLSQQTEIRSSLKAQEGQLHAYLEQANRAIRIILEEGKAQGEFDPTLSTELMLLMFMRVLGLSRREQLFVQEKLSSEELVRQIGQLLFDGFLSKQRSEERL
ncbi:MAG TPA: helix-turn-helix domain-containing protein [Ktedonobacteraceae bacterium]|jgi:AcrR family transcriptional regulator|nr:helix-turn-helix domain-containing protein [Ktedonobacteraceae bacterium]